MIFHDSHRNRFELQMCDSFYVCEVDHRKRLRFIHWGELPPDHSDGPVLIGRDGPRMMNWMSQETHKHYDEVSALGDESLEEPSLSIVIPELAVKEGFEGNHFPVADCRLRFKAYHIGQPEISEAGAPNHGRKPISESGDWLILTLQDEVYPLEVDLCLRPVPEYNILERYLILRNKGDQELVVKNAYAASVQVPLGRWKASWLAGAWGAEFGREEQNLGRSGLVLESRGINTSLRYQPTLFLQRQGQGTHHHGETFGLHLCWSGNWRIHAESFHDYRLRVHLGENPVNNSRILPAGDCFATPMVIAGCHNHGEEGLSRCFQAYHRNRTLAEYLGKRPVLYNSWEATYFNLSVENQIALAEKAASVGVELFVVDDGWFGGRRHDMAGLGDWYVSSDVFPEGLQPLIQRVHELGMKFGIWFEPEMVNPDSDFYREHPNWVLHYPSRPRLEARNQLILDFGNPEVVENIRQQMIRFLENHSVDFIKWDMNRTVNAPGSIAGENIWRRHVEGVYSIMDDLLRRFPRLQIQSCSSGGGRVDGCMLRRAHQVWTSDNTDALDRISIQDGFVQQFPTCTMESWVTHEENHQTHLRWNLPFRFASAMRGVLGIGSRLDKLEENELAEYAHWIDFYKKIRHLVTNGILYRTAHPNLHQGLSVWQFTAEDGSEAYVNAIVAKHTVATQMVPFRLADLQSTGLYNVYDDKGELAFQSTGAELMTLGLSGNDTGIPHAIHQGSAWHYHLVLA